MDNCTELLFTGRGLTEEKWMSQISALALATATVFTKTWLYEGTDNRPHRLVITYEESEQGILPKTIFLDDNGRAFTPKEFSVLMLIASAISGHDRPSMRSSRHCD